ncbi:MAG: hypothetical protein HYV09_24865 [Deltaproteobacteria bacterium]|nr:hypothetical protein [Deltaproteobacteria bacterium]
MDTEATEKILERHSPAQHVDEIDGRLNDDFRDRRDHEPRLCDAVKQPTGERSPSPRCEALHEQPRLESGAGGGPCSAAERCVDRGAHIDGDPAEDCACKFTGESETERDDTVAEGGMPGVNEGVQLGDRLDR